MHVNLTFLFLILFRRNPIRKGRILPVEPLPLIEQALPVSEIARKTTLSRKYISRLYRLYEEEGASAVDSALTRSFSIEKKHIPGSKAQKIDRWLCQNVPNILGSPQVLSALATQELNEVITPNDIAQALHFAGWTKKKKSKVPGLSVPEERDTFLSTLNAVAPYHDMIVAIDEKKLRPGEVAARLGTYGYSPRGVRTGTQQRPIPNITPEFTKVEIFGAIGVLNELPMASGEMGDIGMISSVVQEGKLSFEQIQHFLLEQLPRQLQAWPNAYSVVQIDNMHRVGDLVENLYSSGGIFCAWNPPQSPDLNIIEKFWDLVVSGCARRHLELISGKHGPPRKLNFADLHNILKSTRMSINALHEIGLTCTKRILE